MADIISDIDIPDDVKAKIDPDTLAIMLAGLNASAGRVAPCLIATDPAPTPGQLAEAKLILLGVIKRWAEAGSGAIQARQQSAGPFSVSDTIDTRQRGGWNLWPSDIEQLQDLCRTVTGSEGKAFTITMGPSGTDHLPWCTLSLGGTYCSCGVDIAGEPIYELG